MKKKGKPEREERNEKDQASRLEEMAQALYGIASGDFSVSLDTSPRQDELDTVALGISMMAEDIGVLVEGLRAEKEFVDNAINTLDDIFVVFDLEGKLIRWNKRGNEVGGYDDVELFSMKTTDLFEGEDVRLVSEAIERGLNEGFASVEASLMTKDGRAIPYEFYGTPLRGPDGEPIGVTAIGRDITGRKKADKEITRLSRRVIQEHEETRRKMSADIHDEISQSLNAFKIELDMLRKEEKRLTARAHKRLDAMEELIEYTISTTRGLSAELRPALLDDFGLVEALGLYVEEFSGKTGIKASLECAGLPFELPKDLEIPLFRIAQEALVNVQRHANAREVKVSLTHENEQVALTVEDDGEGFDVEKAFKGDAASDCFGLLGMRERARMVGGELEILSNMRGGTTLVVRVPL